VAAAHIIHLCRRVKIQTSVILGCKYLLLGDPQISDRDGLFEYSIKIVQHVRWSKEIVETSEVCVHGSKIGVKGEALMSLCSTSISTQTARSCIGTEQMRVIRIPLPTSIQIQYTQLQKVENKEPGDS
jgi:hypothetical protein